VGRARTLTAAEKFLVMDTISGGGRVVASRRIARSTRQATAARIYLRDWIRDRYVPNPADVAFPLITFAVTQPYAEMLSITARTWQEPEGCAVLWSSHRTLFGVFFSRNESARGELWRALSEARLGRSIILVSQNLATSVVPVYFDFEAAWGRVAEIEGSVSYPQSLPSSARTPSGPSTSVPSNSERAALAHLLSLPFVSSPRITRRRTGVGSLFGNPEARCLRKGFVELRSFLNPVALSRDVVEFPKRAVFIEGELDGTGTPEGLFADLIQTVGASPFLFTTDGHSVLIGALSIGPRQIRSKRVPSGLALVSVLKRYLKSIVLLEEELEDFEILVDHRYDRLLIA